MNMNLYHDTFDKFCEFIKNDKATILDIACGPGNVMKYLLQKRPDFKIAGLDLAPNMVELAKRNNPRADFHIMDCRDIEILKEKYDAIMCGFCMPYLSKKECAKLIGDSSGLLNTNGLLYISTMEDDYNKSGYEKTSFSGTDMVYIYYHQPDFLASKLERNGFDIIDLQRKNYPEADGTFLTDMIFIAQKKGPAQGNRL